MRKTTSIFLLSLLVFVPFIAKASFDKSLYYGLQGNPQVKELQEFLIDQGYLTGNSTGNFFSLTLSAVKKFQTANGLPSTGYFGTLSRQKANDILAANLQPSNQQATIETGSTPPAPIPPTTTNDVVSALQAQIALLQKQLDALNAQTQATQQTNQQLQQQVQQQTQVIQQVQQNTQQIAQNTTPTPAPIPALTPPSFPTPPPPPTPEPKPIPAPIVSLKVFEQRIKNHPVILKNDGKLFGTIGLQCDVMLNLYNLDWFQKEEWYANDTLIGMCKDSSAKVGFDTTKFPDGDYQLTAKVYYTNGSTRQDTMNVKIQQIPIQ